MRLQTPQPYYQTDVKTKRKKDTQKKTKKKKKKNIKRQKDTMTKTKEFNIEMSGQFHTLFLL